MWDWNKCLFTWKQTQIFQKVEVIYFQVYVFIYGGGGGGHRILVPTQISKFPWKGFPKFLFPGIFVQFNISRSVLFLCKVLLRLPFQNWYNSRNEDNVSIHITIKNENPSNLRTPTSKKKGAFFSLVIVAGDMMCLAVGNQDLAGVKKGCTVDIDGRQIL